MNTSFLTKNVILLLFVPDYEFIESNTIKDSEAPKLSFAVNVYKQNIMTNPLYRYVVKNIIMFLPKSIGIPIRYDLFLFTMTRC